MAKTLTPKHHALMFSFIVKSCLEKLGDNCKETLKNSVILYALGRGGRMAKRALKDGCKLSAFSYLAYGEWNMAKANMDVDVDLLAPEATMKVKSCPWYDAWQEEGHLKYGEIYCKYIDETLAEGFSENVKLDVVCTRTEGHEICDFYFRGESFTQNELKLLGDRKRELGESAMKTWDFHTGHLYSIMKNEIIRDFGEEGKEAVDEALSIYEERFGCAVVEAIMKYKDYDFKLVDDYVGINQKKVKENVHGI